MSLIVVLNGPNLNLLGSREPSIYGRVTWAEVRERLQHIAEERGVEIEFFQSNHEGAIIDFIQGLSGRANGLIINPGALTHYSYSLHDALMGSEIPAIELHLSNIYAREEWRARSVVSPAARGVIAGLGALGYELAMEAMLGIIEASQG
ncbi:MAG: type II 3-dehydroquinate dehydratase [Actinobacteria bacterium]|nr:type II 3-dehydroquinate dehydratase [Actinomycetota bacterium]